MSPSIGPAKAKRRPAFSGGGDEVGSLADERAALLELASALEQWPARNIVFRRALDEAALEIVRMASATLPSGDPVPGSR